MGPLSGKQQREWAKHVAKEQRESAKMEAEEARKQQLHEIKLQEAAAKAGQGIDHKEELHGLKVKELGGPLGGKPKRINRQKLGLPSLNPLAGTEVFHQGQHMLSKGTDTVPAMLTPGEAVIPRAAAQDPKNKPLIKQMVQEGRMANRAKGYADGTEEIPNIAGNTYHTDSVATMSNGTTGVQYYDNGTTNSSYVDDQQNAALAEYGIETPSVNTPIVPVAQNTKPSRVDTEQEAAIAEFVPPPVVTQPKPVSLPEVSAEEPPRRRVVAGPIVNEPVKQVITPSEPIPTVIADPEVPKITSTPLTIAERNFNPGNLRFVGQEGAEKGEGGFARFKSHEEGRKALENQLVLDTQTRGLTLADTMKKYAPAADKNDPIAYANTIAKELGINPNQKVPADKISQMADVITRVESGGKYRAQGAIIPGPTKEKGIPSISDQDQQSNKPSEINFANNLRKTTPDVDDAFNKAKGDERTFVETFKDIFSYKGLKDALGLNNQEVARMATMYFGSRMRGYNGARSLSFAGRNAFETSLHRQDREQQFQNTMIAQDRADARQVKMLEAQDKRALTSKLIEAGYPQEAIDAYFKSGDSKKLGDPVTTTIRTGESRTMMSTDPALYNKPIVVHTVEEKTGKRKGDRYEVAVIDGKEVRLDVLQRQGLSLTPWSETVHGVTGRTERQSKNVEAASKVAASILESELGADNVKGKANPNRQGLPTAQEVAIQAGSYFANMGIDLSNGKQMLEAQNLMSIATRDMLAAKNAGTKVNNIEPYLARNVITHQLGIDPNAMMLEKDKPMPAEKVVELERLARRFSAVSNDGKPNEAQATSEIQRLHQVWANPKSAKLREQFKGTSNETAFYQFATEALRKSLEK